MTKIEKETIDRLTKLTSASMSDKKLALEITRKYINKNAVYCLTCDGVVKIMFNNLRYWWNNQIKNYRFIKEL